MARPDNPEDYVPFNVDDLTVYVSRELLDKQKPGTRRLRFYIGGYGGHWLEFDAPWNSASSQPA